MNLLAFLTIIGNAFIMFHFFNINNLVITNINIAYTKLDIINNFTLTNVVFIL